MFALSLPDSLFEAYYSPVLYDREGKLLGARVALDGQWRFPDASGMGLNEKFIAALIEAEDHRFKWHPGIDPLAIGRALVQNIREGRVVSGGSTITMQTLRLMRKSKGRTVFEKAVEAVLALRLEISLSKDDILKLYAANAPFGANVVGFEAASWRWFGREGAELSWAEAATLAVLPNNPALIHPGRNRDGLRKKRDALLGRLYTKRFFDAETLILAKAENLPEEPLPLPQLAPHLLNRAVVEAGGVANFASGANAMHSPRIQTTLDRTIQERALGIMNRAADRFAVNGIMNGACLVMDTRSGAVAAYVGNVDSPLARDVDIIPAKRSSGSLLKPFLYAAMLDSGDLLPKGLISDIPTRVGSYSPENITRTYLGAVPADEALARSLNVPAVRSLRIFGVDRFARLLRSIGVSTLFRPAEEYGLPLILGGAEVTLWEMAALYGGLARSVYAQTDTGARGTSLQVAAEGPVFFPPRVFAWETAAKIRRPVASAQQALFPETRAPVAAAQRPLSPGAAWLTLDALTFVVRPGEEAHWQEYAGSRRIAWKTGTSFGFRDAWAIGVTPQWTVAVWIGNASGEGRAELRSAVTSAPVLFELFSALDSWRGYVPESNTSKEQPYPSRSASLAKQVLGLVDSVPSGEDWLWFPQPADDLKSQEVCAWSGYPVGPDCGPVKTVLLPRNAPPHRACEYCRTVALNEAEDRQIRPAGNDGRPVVLKKRFVLPPAEEWYYRRWRADYKPLPPPENDAGQLPLALFNPEPFSRIFVPRELDGREGRVVFSAAHREDSALIHWHLDGEYLGSTRVFHEMEARPAPGFHTLTLVDGAGNTLTRRFEVIDNGT
ncbi:penicillin-binding protein 1C [Treponema primitia]|nr:transglycosylase domain-containing protein [Treponema primitia]